MLTRKDYMDGKCTHRQYYGEIVQAAGIKFSSDYELVKRSLEAFKNGNEHLNTIPLHEWDRVAAMQKDSTVRPLKERGDFWSMGGGVCIAKEAVRQAMGVE